MSRSNPTTYHSNTPYPDEVPEHKRHYIGRDKPRLDVAYNDELHWSEKVALGYKATAWPKRDIDVDDERYDLREKEYDE